MNKILWGTCFYPNDSPPPARCGVAFYSKRANINVIDGRTDILKYGNSWKFLSRGSICYYATDAGNKERAVFTGDTLFQVLCTIKLCL